MFKSRGYSTDFCLTCVLFRWLMFCDDWVSFVQQSYVSCCGLPAHGQHQNGKAGRPTKNCIQQVKGAHSIRTTEPKLGNGLEKTKIRRREKTQPANEAMTARKRTPAMRVGANGAQDRNSNSSLMATAQYQNQSFHHAPVHVDCTNDYWVHP